jgi:hypothetical protein
MPDEFKHADEVLRPSGCMLQVFDTLLQLCQVASWMSFDFVLYPHDGSFKASVFSHGAGKIANPCVTRITC